MLKLEWIAVGKIQRQDTPTEFQVLYTKNSWHYDKAMREDRNKKKYLLLWFHLDGDGHGLLTKCAGKYRYDLNKHSAVRNS